MWRKIRYDFSKHHSGHALYDTFTACVPGEGESQYAVYGHLVDDKLILTIRALDSQDPVMIQIFPTNPSNLLRPAIRGGITLMHDWTMHPTIAPALLCDSDVKSEEFPELATSAKQEMVGKAASQAGNALWEIWKQSSEASGYAESIFRDESYQPTDQGAPPSNRTAISRNGTHVAPTPD